MKNSKKSGDFNKMKEYFSLDRFEENFAILEDKDRNFIKILKKILPKDAKEGDVLIKTNEKFEVDAEQTAKLREKIISLQNSLWD